ncbi:hypothetical protein GCM10010168_89240 [Actinoplanes ianthinogenes]|uniref:Tetratricopeptide repeat protein n=1 Tax=Actinoplanes ianthinogenes TaxID=122358 RepID=A0ABN6C9G1_9ACTN|nr:hypothetical protein [Actinoplanes ianthinogenes]BCJ41316.1 hypothetical protein Aiant_19730 [Actinoplanes ianthinogenes]GGR56444.1 hypothetical protein GCM10010168_89240 [Actinoplanes ianthinogenes]
MGGRGHTFWYSAGLPAVAGSVLLAAGRVTAWPAWLGVVAVAGLSGAVALRRRAPAQPDEQPLYVMQRPLRTVAAHGIPADSGYTLLLTSRTHAAVILAPGGATGPEGRWIPGTGHNLTLTVSAPEAEAVTVRSLAATVLATAPFPGPTGLSVISRRMPDLVAGPGLLESLQRSVAAYRPLPMPDAAILLDDQPPAVAALGAAERPPLLVPAAESRSVAFAPVTEWHGWLRWRLTAEIDCAGRTDTVHWDLDVTAACGGLGAAVYELFPDHWDPANEHPGADDYPEIVDLAGHGVRSASARPAPDPEPAEAAELREKAEAEHEAGQDEAAADLWRAAAESGSGPAAYALGVTLRRAGDLDRAAEWLRRAARRRVLPACNDLGAVELARGHTDAAEAWFRRAMDEGDWTAVVNLAAVAQLRGRADEAEQLLRPAHRMHADRAPDALARLLTGQGRLDEAEELLVRDAEGPAVTGPMPSEPHYARLLRLAEFLANVRHDPRAADVLRTALTEPDVPRDAADRARAALSHLADIGSSQGGVRIPSVWP